MKTKLNSISNWLRLLVLAGILVCANSIKAAAPVITWANPPALTYPQPLGAAQLNATADVPGTFSYSPPLGTILDVNTNAPGTQLVLTFIPSVGSPVLVINNVIVNRSNLSVTPNSKTRFYGQANPTLDGVVVGTTNASDNIGLIYNTSATTNSPTGAYSITVTMNDPLNRGTNYFITLNDATLTVNAATLTVTPTNVSKVYGATIGANNMGYILTSSTWTNDLTNITAVVKALNAAPTNETDYLTVSFPAAGAYSIVVGAVTSISSAGLITNYNVVKNTGTLTVTAAPLSFTGTNQTIAYGGTPALSSQIIGRQTNAEFDDITNITVTTTTAGVNPGTYTIVPTPVENPVTPGRLLNYNVTIIPGQLTITNRTPVITWTPSPISPITYGTALSGTQLNASVAGAGTGFQAPSALTYSPASGAVLNAGSAIELVATSAGNTWYNTVKKTNTLTVLKSTPTIVWTNPAALTYGYPLTAAQLNAFVQVPGLSPAGILGFDPGVGVYPFAGPTNLAALVAQTTNYFGAVTNITLTVGKGTAAFSGLLSAIGPGVSTIPLSGVVTVGDKKATGAVNITLVMTNLATTNLYIVPLLADGSFSTNVAVASSAVTNAVRFPVTYVYDSINDANVIGATNSQTIVVSAPQPQFSNLASPTYTYGVTAVRLGGKIKVGSTGLAGQPVDVVFDGTTYTTTSAGDGSFTNVVTVAANYLTVGASYPIDYRFAETAQYKGVTNSAQSVVITRRTMWIVAQDTSRLYGAANPSPWTAGVVNPVAADASSIAATVTTTATINSAVGSYPMTPNVVFTPAILQNNYLIAVTNSATLTINPVTISIWIDDKIKGVGQDNPPLTAAITGFVLGQTTNVLTPQLQLQTTATTASPVGNYNITPETTSITAPNYVVTFTHNPGNLAVRVAYIVWGPLADIFYGDTLGAAQKTATAYMNGTNDTRTSPYTYTLVDGVTSIVGYAPPANSAFPIVARYVNGATTEYYTNTINVKQAALLVRGNDASINYGAAIPAIGVPTGYTVYGLVHSDSIATALSTSQGTISVTTQDGNTTLAVGSTTSAAGSYLVKVAGAAGPNYSVTLVDGVFTINKLPTTLTWALGSTSTNVYGTVVDGTVLNASGLPAGGTYVYKLGNAIITNGVTILPGGSNVLTVAYTPDANHVTANLTNYTIVNPYPVNVYVQYSTTNGVASNMTYHAAVPAFPSVTSSLGTNAANLTNFIVFAGTNTSQVTRTSAGAISNIWFATTQGADSVRGLGFQLTTTATNGSPIGAYQVSLTATGANAGNFNFNVAVDRMLNVTQAVLTVTTPTTGTKAYGAPKPSFASFGTVSANDDTITATWDSIVGTNSPVGVYTIVPTLVDPNNKLGNYSIIWAPTGSQLGSGLTVTPLTISGIANNKTKRPGQAIPVLDATYIGWLSGNPPGGFVPAVWTTAAQVSSPVGSTWPITVQTAATAPNYAFNMTDGVLTVAVNTAPVAMPDQAFRPTGDVVAVPKFKLLSNDYDVDGDAIQLVSVAAVSANGATIQTDSYWVYYIPISGPNATNNDTFTYTITDNMGGTAVGTVNVVVRDSSIISIPKNIVDVQPTPEGYRTLTFAGLPNVCYNVQGTVPLVNPNWQTIVSTETPNPRQASAVGLVTFTDTEAPIYPQRFYRIVATPCP